jgi:succinate-acetate transporter protein
MIGFARRLDPGLTDRDLAAGNYRASVGVIKTGGWIGLAVAVFAFYLSLAEVCEASYGREVLPVGHLAKK